MLQKTFPCRVALPLVATCCIKCQCGIPKSSVVFLCVKHVANVIHCIESDTCMFIIFQGCMLLRLSICGTLDLMGFHRIAFGPSPQQNHLVGRGD